MSDPSIINGTREGEIPVQLADVIKDDASGKTKFEVAGRLYFESTVAAPGYKSFVTNGFFDREGY